MRNYHILRGLLENHAVTLLSYLDGPLEEGIPSQLSGCEKVQTLPAPSRSKKRRLLQLLTSSEPDLARRIRGSEFANSLRDLLSSSSNDQQPAYFDFVQVEGLELAWTIPTIREMSPESMVIFDNHNAETELQRRSFDTDKYTFSRWPAAGYSWLQARQLARFESWACQNSDWVTVVSEQDKRYIVRLAPSRSITVIPNCIDTFEYLDLSHSPGLQFDMVFVGKMDYRPNVDAVLWFAKEIWPKIRGQRPEATWAIVGQKPHSRLNWVRELDGVTVTGWVEKVQPYLAGAQTYVMPFRIGSGTRLKLIEAMAAAKAVVSTTIGAEGFELKHNQHLLFANNPGSFANAVLRLLDDSTERDRLGSAARTFAAQYDWRQVVPLFDEVYEQVQSGDRNVGG